MLWCLVVGACLVSRDSECCERAKKKIAHRPTIFSLPSLTQNQLPIHFPPPKGRTEKTRHYQAVRKAGDRKSFGFAEASPTAHPKEIPLGPLQRAPTMPKSSTQLVDSPSFCSSECFFLGADKIVDLLRTVSLSPSLSLSPPLSVSVQELVIVFRPCLCYKTT